MRRWLAAAAALGVAALLASAAGVAHRGTFQPSERVLAEDAVLRWIELPPQPRTTSTQAMVVEGWLRNTEARRSPLVRVSVVFLDAAGQPIGSAMGYPDGWGVPADGEVPFRVAAVPDPHVASFVTRVEEAPEPGLGALSLRAVLEGFRT